MDIKKLLNGEGKIDPNKLFAAVTSAENWGELNAITEAINDHIASLKQETPITPELLLSAKFKRNGTMFEYLPIVVNQRMEVWIYQVKFENCKTMENLSMLKQMLNGKPLNWQHDPVADLRKRLEAIGFEEERRGHYSLFYGSTFRVFLTEDLSDILHIGLGEYPEIGIKTIDELEEVMKRIVDKDDNTANYSVYCPECKNRGRGGDTLGCGHCGRVSWH